MGGHMVDLGKLNLKAMRIIINPNDPPIGNGGGTCKTIEDVEKFCKTSIPIVEIGSITEENRPGNTGDTFYPGSLLTLNSLGLPNGGRPYYEKYLSDMTSRIKRAGKQSMVNVAGFNAEEYSSLTKLAFSKGADYVVLNYGCPNVWGDNKEQKCITSHDHAMLRHATEMVLAENDRGASGHIGIKLSPLYPTDILKTAQFLNSLFRTEKNYIGFITTMNTVPNCYEEIGGHSVITPAGGLAGMAGQAIGPIARGQVMEFRRLLDKKIDIIGVGGVSTGEDVTKMLGCGAHFVQIVSAYYKSLDVGVFEEIGAQYMLTL
jgi:dihydroorotate dehydrogenase (fumarate)